MLRCEAVRYSQPSVFSPPNGAEDEDDRRHDEEDDEPDGDVNT